MLTHTLWLLAALLSAEDARVQADYLIERAEIHDGSGGVARTGDLAIRGDRMLSAGTAACTSRTSAAKVLAC